MRSRWMVIAVWLAALALGAAPIPASGPALRAQAPISLMDMLAQVPDSPVARSVIWYGALGDLERALGVAVDSREAIDQLAPANRIAYLFEIGRQVYYSAFSGMENAPDWANTFAVNSFGIERELTIGAGLPDQYAVLQGAFAPDAISAALEGLGYQSTPIGGVPVFSLGADDSADPGNPAQALAGSRYNRLFVTPGQIIAAPSSRLMEMALATGRRIIDDPAYNALVMALSDPDVAPGSPLISAALFEGGYLNQIAREAARSLPAEQIGLDLPLPPYLTAGLGYRRDAQDRHIVIALTYGDEGLARLAADTLVQRMGRYLSIGGGAGDPPRQPFYGWRFTPQIIPVADGRLHVLTLTAMIPPQTDVAWVELAAAGDVGFLAAD